MLERGKPQAAPGPDAIPNLVLQKLGTVLACPITDIFNACLETGHFPTLFRRAIVVSVPKPGKDPLSTAGYRPIALLSTLGKKLETLLCTRLTSRMEKSKIWSDFQYGFRRNKSTTQAISRLMDRATRALNNRKQLLVISFDLQAAFDSTDPDIMWKTLLDTGMPRYLLRMLDGFFRDREACLLVGPESWPFYPTRGVSQGSPLSPALFITFANGVLSALTCQVEGQMYADD